MKKLFFALPFLLAGCQSERVAFQFQPAASAVSVAPTGMAVTRPAATNGGLEPGVVAANQLPAEGFSKANSPALTLQKTRKKLRQVAIARPEVPLTTPVAAVENLPALARLKLSEALALRRLMRQHATAGPARTTESGLGNIGLFVIAVVLGILAGLGALVALIPGVSFLGGVGLAAAGLVVVFLLYSLLSGGGKKK